MREELLLRAISNGTIGILIVAVLLVLLISLRKDIGGGEPLRGLFHLTIVAIGLFAFIGLLVIHFQAKRMMVPEKISHRMETAANSLPKGAA